ncbi:MAG: chlorite dismutase family protein [Chloroflexi bacterium]|nr:chlorite dismutase family protein [Chloroflexota bacterium]
MTPGKTAVDESRQFVRYAFYKVAPEWRRLPTEERARSKSEFEKVVREIAQETLIRPYSLVGTRGDVDFLLWEAADTLDDLHQVAARLNLTHLGRHSEQPYSYLAMTRMSPYVGRSHYEARGQEPLKVRPTEAKYLFIYPFVKTREWYKLPHDWRRVMMGQHVAMGGKFPSVKINTAYSFGLDDQEFMVAFETDSPSDFLDLVMELRESQASAYTLRDTPTFSCIATDIQSALDAVAG